jgi:thioredoxin 1
MEIDCTAAISEVRSMGAAATFSQENFESEVLKSDKPVLVDFWAPWCGPCKMIAPLIEQIASDESHRFVVGKLNVDEAPQVASKYRVGSIPALLIFKGGQVVQQFLGANTRREQLVKALESAA